MNLRHYALCVRFSGVNTAHIVAAARQHAVAVLHIESYNSKKDYTTIFEEYPLEIPRNSRLSLLFIFSDGGSVITDKQQIPQAFEKVDRYLLDS